MLSAVAYLQSPTMSIAERPGSGSEVDMSVAQPVEGHEQEHVRVLAQPAHCPPSLARKVWDIKQFRLEKVLYVGTISRVLRAVDIASGMTVALKVYKKHKLTDMEKYVPASLSFAHFWAVQN
jgi:serine/threonine protein kinase